MQEIWDSITGWAGDHLTNWTMIKMYMACAIAGGAVIIGQTGLNLFGFGGDTDVDPDTDVDALDGGDSLSFLSVRALAGFLTFFGLVGWHGTANEWGTGVSAAAALGSGSLVMVFVAIMMRMFKRLSSSGNIRPDDAVGLTASVYLRIPGEKAGKGKITVKLQGQSVEFEALTSGPELKSGSECRIVRRVTDTTFEVAALDD